MAATVATTTPATTPATPATPTTPTTWMSATNTVQVPNDWVVHRKSQGAYVFAPTPGKSCTLIIPLGAKDYFPSQGPNPLQISLEAYTPNENTVRVTGVQVLIGQAQPIPVPAQNFPGTGIFMNGKVPYSVSIPSSTPAGLLSIGVTIVVMTSIKSPFRIVGAGADF